MFQLYRERESVIIADQQIARAEQKLQEDTVVVASHMSNNAQLATIGSSWEVGRYPVFFNFFFPTKLSTFFHSYFNFHSESTSENYKLTFQFISSCLVICVCQEAFNIPFTVGATELALLYPKHSPYLTKLIVALTTSAKRAKELVSYQSPTF